MASAILSKKELAAKFKAAVAAKALKRISDGDGLMLVVRENGAASWVLRTQFNGQRPDFTLGQWPGLDLDGARVLAGEYRDLIAKGVDPRQQRPAPAPVAPKTGDSVRQLMLDWIEKEAFDDKYAGDIRAAFVKDVLPAIGSMAPGEVTRGDVLKILRAIEARGSHEKVRRVRMWMKQMFEWAVDHEAREITVSPVPTGNLRSFAKHDPSHFAAITSAAEVPALMAKINAYGSTITRFALLFSAHVWQRPQEVREATWSEFDLGARRWVIPARRMKMNREHWVPLSTHTTELLMRLQGVVGNEGWLFPGRKRDEAISDGNLRQALIYMGYRGRHTPHGFRSMARTIGDEVLGIDPRYLEKQLSHEKDDSGLAGAYNRAEYWEQRVRMMQRWSDWLAAQ